MPRCWYCGTRNALVGERKHQLPLHRGGLDRVSSAACRRCRQLKGIHTVEEFRALLLGVLGQPILFFGEAESGQRHSADVATARQHLAEQRMIKRSGSLAIELADAVRTLHAQGLSDRAIAAIAHQIVDRRLHQLPSHRPFSRPVNPEQYEQPPLLELSTEAIW